MNIYLLEQTAISGYDTYESCVVFAENEEKARLIHPAQYIEKRIPFEGNYGWTNNPDLVKVTLLGVTSKEEKESVIVSSFNAG
jgi:hypothetical protein